MPYRIEGKGDKFKCLWRLFRLGGSAGASRRKEKAPGFTPRAPQAKKMEGRGVSHFAPSCMALLILLAYRPGWNLPNIKNSRWAPSIARRIAFATCGDFSIVSAREISIVCGLIARSRILFPVLLGQGLHPVQCLVSDLANPLMREGEADSDFPKGEGLPVVQAVG